MKCVLIMILAICASVLCGCTGETAPTTDTELSTLPYEELTLKAVDDPVGTLTQYDPQREIYVTFDENAVSVFSSNDYGWSQLLFCRIYSKSSIDPEAVTITASMECNIDILSRREYDIKKQTELSAGVSSEWVLPYYVYQVYRGVDINDEKAQESIKADFMRLSEEHFPQFHVYSIVLSLSGEAVNEITKLEYLDVSIEEKPYRVDPGHILIYPPEDDPYRGLDPSQDYFTGCEGVNNGTGSFSCPYNNGYGCCPVIDMNVQRDFVITGAQVYCPGVEVLDWNIQIISADGTILNYYWDGTSNITLSQGDRIKIDVYFHNAYIGKVEPGAWSLNIKIDCLEEERYAYLVSSFTNTGTMNVYEEFAMVFLGVDMSAYYQSYYEKNELWIQDYQ